MKGFQVHLLPLSYFALKSVDRLALFAILLCCVGLMACAGSGSDGPDCLDCVTASQLAEEYEANSIRAREKYVGKRHNFAGEVQSIENDLSVPPKPLVRIKSGGDDLALRFDWDGDHSWVTELSKGDRVRANCVITRLGPNIFQGGKVIPSLEQCTQGRMSSPGGSDDDPDRDEPFPTVTPLR